MFGICDSRGGIIARFAAPMTVRSNQPIYSSDTLSLKRQSTRRSAQRWEIETNLEPLTGGANDLFVDIVSKGYDEVVYVKMPQNIGAINARGNAQTVSVSSLSDLNYVTVSNNVFEGKSNLIPSGTFFTISGIQKVYMTIGNRLGDGTIQVYPALKEIFSNRQMNIYNNVIGEFYYDLDTIRGMVFTDGILMDNGTVKLVEAL